MAHITKTVTGNPVILSADATSSFTTTTGNLTLESTNGNLILVGGVLFTIDAVGALSINSSAGPINIGDDPAAQNINIGTGISARTITIGNTTSSTTLKLNSRCGL